MAKSLVHTKWLCPWHRCGISAIVLIRDVAPDKTSTHESNLSDAEDSPCFRRICRRQVLFAQDAHHMLDEQGV